MTNTPQISAEQLFFIVQNESTDCLLSEELSEEALRELSLKTLEQVLASYEDDFEEVELTLRIVDSEEAHQLNRQYRDKDYPTNVLTFEYGIDETATLRADIVICVAVVQKEAEEQNKTFADHFKHLLVHGVLHSLGFDHQNDEEAESMEALEIEILGQFSIKNPYI
ncbi:MAG: rRNA maturation RNase YbeY [Alcaligenaceae bacterium]|nr:rRNA maturation RNase YbeY [Alcaligenaceae bacterium]